METQDHIGLYLPKYAFWDVSTEKLNVSDNKGFIISRMFERGKLDDVLSTVAYYGKEESINALRNNKYLNRSGLFLAHTLLGLPLRDFKAYATLKHN